METKSSSLSSLNTFVDNLFNKVNQDPKELKKYYLPTTLGFVLFVLIIYVLYVFLLPVFQCAYINQVYPNINGVIQNINSINPVFTHKFKDYYIKTAYNCCSSGNYRNDYVNLCNLKSVLRQGVRCLDFEIYNMDSMPIVATSTNTNNNFYIKETYNYIPFEEVMNMIISHAFSISFSPNSEDPIIINLRMKTNDQEVYTYLSTIFKYYNSYFLGSQYSYADYGDNFGDIPLLSLKKKIVLIVDGDKRNILKNPLFLEYVNLIGNSIHLRELRYKDVLNGDITELQKYNASNLSICLCDLGIEPQNSDIKVLTNAGIQMMSMCFQNMDEKLKDYNAFFDNYGYAFVLKPESLRSISSTTFCPPCSN